MPAALKLRWSVAPIPGRTFFRAERLQGREPSIEHRLYAGRVLEIPAVNRARPRIEIQIHEDAIARLPIGVAGEVPIDVRLGSEQAFFFAAPQREPDGPARTHAGGLQYSGGLEHAGGAVRVVGRARARVPRIDVRPDDDELIADLRIRTREIADHVVPVRIGGDVVGSDVDAQLHPRAALQPPGGQGVVFPGPDAPPKRRPAFLAAPDEPRAVLAA